MANKIKTQSFSNERQILFMTEPRAAVGVIVSDAEVTADSEGRKIVKAGTPLTGSLEARQTAFTIATDTASGILLHDVDVTYGAENATLLIFGFVDINKIDSDVVVKITDEVQTALSGKVTFIK